VRHARPPHLGQDETWLTTGVQGDRFEIIGGTAAQWKARPAR
jgi:hypothetical protein